MVSGISSNSYSDFSSLSMATSSSVTTSYGAKASNIMDVFWDNFAKSFSKDAETNSDKKKEMLKNIIAIGDKDGDNGLSMSELSSIDTKGNTEEKDAVNSLISQFKSLDKNNDGVLSLDEMKDVKLKQQYSIEELSQMYKCMKNSKKNDDSTNIYAGLGNKFINNYQKDIINEVSGSVVAEA